MGCGGKIADSIATESDADQRLTAVGVDVDFQAEGVVEPALQIIG